MIHTAFPTSKQSGIYDIINLKETNQITLMTNQVIYKRYTNSAYVTLQGTNI